MNVCIGRVVRVGWLLVAVSGLVMTGKVAAQDGGDGQRRFKTVDDAAVVMAKQFQAGGKAKPIITDDGKVVFPFGQTMPKVTCSPTRACDVEMQAGEKIKDVILGDGKNWQTGQSESMERGQPVQHLIIQPRDSDVETNVIVTTNRRTYHIKLYAPKKEGVYLNRVGFYYPEEMVTAWNYQGQQQQAAAAAEEKLAVVNDPVSPEDLDFDYKIEGDADFRPTRVYNNGRKVYLLVPKSVFKSGEAPPLFLEDDKGRVNQVNYDVRPDKGLYIVNRLFTKAIFQIDDQRVTVTWNKKAGWSWGKGMSVFGGAGS